MSWPIARPYTSRTVVALALLIIVLGLAVGVLDHVGWITTWSAMAAMAIPAIVTIIFAIEHSMRYQISPEGIAVRGFMTNIKLERWNIVNVTQSEYRPSASGPELSGIGLRCGGTSSTPYGPARFFGGRNVRPAVLVVLDDGSRTLLTPERPQQFLDELERWGFPVNTKQDPEVEAHAWTA